MQLELDIVHIDENIIYLKPNNQPQPVFTW